MERDLVKRIIAVMEAMPTTEREVIALAYFGGMTYREVAVHLGVAESTVRSRMRRGLARMRLMLDVLEQED